ncbi:MAG: zinc ribbon domain-containing protein [Pseudomonadota bacterium]
MPIYEYACEKCGKIFEEFQSIKADPLKRCKLCSSKTVHRIVSHTSFILKGSGWYVTDYARKDGSNGGNGKKTGKDNKAEKEAASSPDSKGKESQPPSPSVAKSGKESGSSTTTT